MRRHNIPYQTQQEESMPKITIAELQKEIQALKERAAVSKNAERELVTALTPLVVRAEAAIDGAQDFIATALEQIDYIKDALGIDQPPPPQGNREENDHVENQG
jgi:hypothetical protein